MSYTNDRRNRRVSGRQLDLLWEFLNSHRDIAVAYNRSLQAKEYSTRKWREIAEILNSQGDGAYKDWKTWSKYWVDHKAKLKKRAAAIHSSRRRTGGGSSSEPPLNEYEEKFLSVLGDGFGQGLPGVRVEPFGEPSTSTTGTAVSQSILADPEVVQEHQSTLRHPLLGDGEVEEIIIDPPPQPQSDQEAEVLVEEVERAVTPSPAPNPAEVGETLPHRRRSRNPSLTREDARRLLVESSQQRANAAVRSSEAMEGVDRSLQNISNNLSLMLENMQEIRRILVTAFPRAAE